MSQRTTPNSRGYRLQAVIIFVFLALPNPSFGQSGMNGPNSTYSKQISDLESYPETSTSKLIGKGFINFFSSWISPVDGPRSPSYPTGSAYGREAVQRYGLVLGVILTADRLIHEADVHLGPIVTLHGTRRYYDPVEANTFWWESKKTVE